MSKLEGNIKLTITGIDWAQASSERCVITVSPRQNADPVFMDRMRKYFAGCEIVVAPYLRES